MSWFTTIVIYGYVMYDYMVWLSSQGVSINYIYNELWYSPDGATAIRVIMLMRCSGRHWQPKQKQTWDAVFNSCVPKCNNFGGHKFPSEATAKNAANVFRCEWVPYLSEYVCNLWLRSDGRVARKGGYRHTDSWHEWLQDNFYGGSTTKRIVIKEPSLVSYAVVSACSLQSQ